MTTQPRPAAYVAFRASAEAGRGAEETVEIEIGIVIGIGIDHQGIGQSGTRNFSSTAFPLATWHGFTRRRTEKLAAYGAEPVEVDPDFDSDFDPEGEKPQGGGGAAMPSLGGGFSRTSSLVGAKFVMSKT